MLLDFVRCGSWLLVVVRLLLFARYALSLVVGWLLLLSLVVCCCVSLIVGCCCLLSVVVCCGCYLLLRFTT